MAADQAHPQMNPAVAGLQAILAAVGAGCHLLKLVGVRAGSGHAQLLFLSVSVVAWSIFKRQLRLGQSSTLLSLGLSLTAF
jgi:hypothetical protein